MPLTRQRAAAQNASSQHRAFEGAGSGAPVQQQTSHRPATLSQSVDAVHDGVDPGQLQTTSDSVDQGQQPRQWTPAGLPRSENVFPTVQQQQQQITTAASSLASHGVDMLGSFDVNHVTTFSSRNTHLPPRLDSPGAGMTDHSRTPPQHAPSPAFVGSSSLHPRQISHQTPNHQGQAEFLNAPDLQHNSTFGTGQTLRFVNPGVTTAQSSHEGTPLQHSFDLSSNASISPHSTQVSASPGNQSDPAQSSMSGLGLGLSSTAQRYNPQHLRQSSLGQMGALAQAQRSSGYIPLRLPAGTSPPFSDCTFDNGGNQGGPSVPGRITTRTGTTPSLANMTIFAGHASGPGNAGSASSNAAFVRSLSQRQHQSNRSSSPSGSVGSSWNSPNAIMVGSNASSNFSPLTTSTTTSESRFPAAASMNSRDTSMDSFDNSASASRASSTSEDLFSLDSRGLARSLTKKKVKLLNIDRKRICERHEANPKLKQEELASVFGVERSTVSKVLKEKTRWLAVEEDSLDAKIVKHRQAKFPEVEKRTMLWAQQAQASGEILTDAIIKEQALAIGKSIGGPAAKFKASGGWVDKFRVRSGLRKNCARSAHAADGDMNAMQQAISESPQHQMPGSPSQNRLTRAAMSAAAVWATTSSSLPSSTPGIDHSATATVPQTPLNSDDTILATSMPVNPPQVDSGPSDMLLDSDPTRTTPTSKQKRQYDSIASAPLALGLEQQPSADVIQHWDALRESEMVTAVHDSKRRRGPHGGAAGQHTATDGSTDQPSLSNQAVGVGPNSQRAATRHSTYQHSQPDLHDYSMASQPPLDSAAATSLGSPFSELDRLPQQQQLERDIIDRRFASIQNDHRVEFQPRAQHSAINPLEPLQEHEQTQHHIARLRDAPTINTTSFFGLNRPVAKVSEWTSATINAHQEQQPLDREGRPISPLRPLRLSDLGRSSASPQLSAAGPRQGDGPEERVLPLRSMSSQSLVNLQAHSAVALTPSGQGSLPSRWARSSSRSCSPATRGTLVEDHHIEEPVTLEQARQSLDIVLQFLNESEADIIPRSHFLTLGSLHGSLAAAAERSRGERDEDA